MPKSVRQQNAEYIAVAAQLGLKVGTMFDTEFERGCIVTDLSGMPCGFYALDSDGVECMFNILMVVPSSVRSVSE